jgi:hypothetical protein
MRCVPGKLRDLFHPHPASNRDPEADGTTHKRKRLQVQVRELLVYFSYPVQPDWAVVASRKGSRRLDRAIAGSRCGSYPGGAPS